MATCSSTLFKVELQFTKNKQFTLLYIIKNATVIFSFLNYYRIKSARKVQRKWYIGQTVFPINFSAYFPCKLNEEAEQNGR